MLTPGDKMAQASTLRLQFPVSSGSQHHAKEDEWIPVEKPSAPASSQGSSGGGAGSGGTAAAVESTASSTTTTAPEDKVFPDMADVVS